LLLTSNLSAERKKMLLAGVNIATAVALVEDYCCFHYAANAIEAPLASGYRAVRTFQETGQYTRRPGSGRKRATTHRDDRFLNNNGVPLFLPVSVLVSDRAETEACYAHAIEYRQRLALWSIW
jgi:hypothetical protein